MNVEHLNSHFPHAIFPNSINTRIDVIHSPLNIDCYCEQKVHIYSFFTTKAASHTETLNFSHVRRCSSKRHCSFHSIHSSNLRKRQRPNLAEDGTCLTVYARPTLTTSYVNIPIKLLLEVNASSTQPQQQQRQRQLIFWSHSLTVFFSADVRRRFLAFVFFLLELERMERDRSNQLNYLLACLHCYLPCRSPHVQYASSSTFHSDEGKNCIYELSTVGGRLIRPNPLVLP